MKNKNVIKLLIATNIITIILCFFISTNKNIIKEKQIGKEMTQSEIETNLQTQIDNLNITHEEYSTNVQTYKKQIADAITNQGVTTSENDTASVMAENIAKILENNKTEGTWRLGLTLEIGYNNSSYARTTFSPICDVTLKDGELSVSYLNENYQSVSIIGKTITVDPCSPMTIEKIN